VSIRSERPIEAPNVPPGLTFPLPTHLSHRRDYLLIKVARNHRKSCASLKGRGFLPEKVVDMALVSFGWKEDFFEHGSYRDSAWML
jgi:hypothetical protein